MIYIPDFVSEEEQTELLKVIDSQIWLSDLKRKTQHYGYKYDYTKKTVDSSLKLGPLPDWLHTYTDRLVKRGIFSSNIDQVIVNQYQPGQGIGRHIDCVPCFGPIIASLSLNSTCLMEFEHLPSNKKGGMMLESRSLLVLTKEARYEWMHSIPARKEDKFGEEVLQRTRRVSLTFRTVSGASRNDNE